MMSFAPKRRMGWLPDYPDFRDYTEDTEAIQDLLHPESAPASGRAATAATSARPRRRTSDFVSRRAGLRGPHAAGTSCDPPAVPSVPLSTGMTSAAHGP